MPESNPEADIAFGTPVYDQATGAYGTVTDVTTLPGTVFVRPAGGGTEWTARRQDVRPVPASELLEDRVRTDRARRWL
jgi:hypothetical protein